MFCVLVRNFECFDNLKISGDSTNQKSTKLKKDSTKRQNCCVYVFLVQYTLIFTHECKPFMAKSAGELLMPSLCAFLKFSPWIS